VSSFLLLWQLRCQPFIMAGLPSSSRCRSPRCRIIDVVGCCFCFCVVIVLLFVVLLLSLPALLLPVAAATLPALHHGWRSVFFLFVVDASSSWLVVGFAFVIVLLSCCWLVDVAIVTAAAAVAWPVLHHG
jgi:hypothetical protein